MMSHELKKLFTRKNRILMAAAVVLNLLLLLLDTMSSNHLAKVEVYRHAFVEMTELSNQQKFSYLQKRVEDLNSIDTLEEYEERCVLEEMQESARIMADYDLYLDTLQDNAEQKMAISREGSYLYQNAEKMLEGYAKLEGTEVSFESYKGVQLADVTLTNVVMLFLMVYICMEGLIHEKESGMLTILRCCKKGRASLLRQKVCALAVWSMVIDGVFLCTNLAFGASVYGLGNLMRPLQSIPGYEGCTHTLSVLGFLLVVWMLRALALFFVGIVTVLLVITSYDMPIVLCGSILVEGIGYLCYQTVDERSVIAIVHYLNPIALLKGMPLLNPEVNLNCFGFPADPMVVTVGVFFVLCLALFGVSVFYFEQNKEGRQRIKILQFRKKTRTYSVSVRGGEGYKLLVSKAGIVGLLLVLAVQLWGSFGQRTQFVPRENYEQHVIRQLQGEVEEEKRIWLEEEYALQEIRRDQQGYTIGVDVLDGRIFPLANHLEEKQKETGEASFISQIGYEKLFGFRNQSNDRKNTLIFTILIVCVLSTYVCMEYTGDMKRLIVPTKVGWRKVCRIKYIFAILYSVFAMLLVWMPDTIQLLKTYELKEWNAPMNWLLEFKDYPDGFTIGMYTLILFLTRILGSVLAACVVTWISQKCKSNTGAFGVCAFVMILPALLALLQIPGIEGISLVGVLDGNYVIQALCKIL